MNVFDPNSIFITDNLDKFGELIKHRNIVIITDDNLYNHYHSFIDNHKHIVFSHGENSKTLSNIEDICHKLLMQGADRQTMLIGFGGGLVTDITGFVASIYMRGIDFGFVSTTLLGQLDASVGGKNGVNLKDYKNIIGCFNNPKWVLCPTSILSTLPERELISGYAEALKCGLIRSRELFNLLTLPTAPLSEIIKLSIGVKSKIVQDDFTEQGDRKLLNLGHTFAHAIEKSSPNEYLHGEAVAIGLVMMCKISNNLGLLKYKVMEHIISTIEKLSLPTTTNIPIDTLQEAILLDKKQNGENIDFILLEDIENPIILNSSIEIVKLLK